jgi:hypothetical protein
MSFDSSKVIQICGLSLAIAAITATPLLTIHAFRGWLKLLRTQLPPWRSALGLISIASILLMPLGIGIDGWHWIIFEVLTLLLGIILALALKSPSRALTLSAGLLMLIVVWASVNF